MSEEAESDVVGTQNEARLARMSEIGDNAEQDRDGELVDAPEKEVFTEVSEDNEAAEQKEEPKQEPRKLKLKLNGQEVEKTEEEVLALAQKVGSADEYLRQASEAFKKTQLPRRDVEAVRNSDEEDLALVRAIQMGTEEEAVQAVRKLKTNPSKPDDMARLVDERLAFQKAADEFGKEYKDILEDPFLSKLVFDKDNELLRSGDSRPYIERYRSIGDEVRAWKNGLTKSEPKTLAEKQQRKSNVVQIKSANARAEPERDEEPDDSPASVISRMAARRGQNI